MLMTTMVLAMMVQTPSATVDRTRVAFTKCLNTHMVKSLDGKKTPTEFEMGLKSICTAERDAFHAAVIALNRASGDSAADAADNADLQIEDYHANFSEKFKDYSDTGTRPG